MVLPISILIFLSAIGNTICNEYFTYRAIRAHHLPTPSACSKGLLAEIVDVDIYIRSQQPQSANNLKNHVDIRVRSHRPHVAQLQSPVCSSDSGLSRCFR